MAGKIPQEFINDLVSRVDIVDIIGSRVALRKAGRDLAGRCPFHEEKTPSFTVSPGKQFYHCFGCGAHGTVIGFLMEYDRLDFVEAVHELARQAGVEVPHGDDQTTAAHQDLYAILEKSAAYYRKQLSTHLGGQQAIDYLKKRGLTGEIAKRFGIGYAPGGWDNLIKNGASTEARKQQLIDAGLAIRKQGGGIYDRFRDRIMFPIRDRRGRVVGFGGRALGSGTPKYLNSPETAVFHKGKFVYGLFEAGEAPAALDFILVVEGYMDVIALAQHSICNVVATLGTAATADQFATLFRRTTRVVMCFDGDAAGVKAAWRALETALPLVREGRELGFIMLPEGEDPDSLIRKEGTNRFLARIERAIPFSRFFFDGMTQRIDLSTVEGRAKLVELAQPLLSKIPDGVFKQMMFDQLAEISKLDTAQFQKRNFSGRSAGHGAAVRRPTQASVSPVRLAIAILLYKPGLAEHAAAYRPQLEKISRPGMGLLCDLIELLVAHPNMTCGAVIERWRGQKEGQQLSRIAQGALPIPEDGLQAEFNGAIERLLSLYREQETERLLEKARSKGLNDDEKAELRTLLSRPAADITGMESTDSA